MSTATDTGIFIGVGHTERQDDGVGPYVARSLHRRGLPAIVHEGDCTGLLDLWDGRRACIVVDAVADPNEMGTVRVFTDFEDHDFAQTAFVHSTHQLGVPEAVALGHTLRRLPGRLVVIGVAGTAFSFGNMLSPPVAFIAKRLVDRFARAEDAFSNAVIAGLLPL